MGAISSDLERDPNYPKPPHFWCFVSPFYPCGTSSVRVLAIIVCPSVCVSHAGTVSKRLNVGSRKQRHVIAKGLYFSDAKSRWWMNPFPLTFALKVTHPLSTSSSALSDKTTPLLLVICHPVARIDIGYLCTKFDDFRFSRSSDVIGAPKIL